MEERLRLEYGQLLALADLHRAYPDEISEPLRLLGQGMYGEVQLCAFKPVSERRPASQRADAVPVGEAAVKTAKLNTLMMTSADGELTPMARRVVTQFLLEARVLGALQHPNIVAVQALQVFMMTFRHFSGQ